MKEESPRDDQMPEKDKDDGNNSEKRKRVLYVLVERSAVRRDCKN
jgi:hypothetical protein